MIPKLVDFAPISADCAENQRKINSLQSIIFWMAQIVKFYAQIPHIPPTIWTLLESSSLRIIEFTRQRIMIINSRDGIERDTPSQSN